MKTIISACLVTSAFGLALHAQDTGTGLSDSVAMEAIELFDTLGHSGNETKFFGDYYIGIDEVSRDNIRIFGGDLFVAGTVEGQIVVLGGDVTLESPSVVNGRIVAIGGTVLKKEGAVVNGRVVEANIKEGITYSEGLGRQTETGTKTWEPGDEAQRERESWIHPEVNWFVYNRNEGFLWTPINWHWDRRSLSTVRLNLSLGYRFGQGELAGRFMLEKSFPLGLSGQRRSGLTFFAAAFQESRTDDGYRLPEKENTLASLFARQDFYDRWNEQGYELGLGIHLRRLQIKTAYRSARIDSISITRRQLKTFHEDRLFRVNIPVVPDQVRSVTAMIKMRTGGLEALSSGAGFLLIGEQILEADSLDRFRRIITLVTANWRLAPDIVLRSRFLLGTAEGILPNFRHFGVGGLGSVSAHPYKIQKGDRTLQVNVELVFLPDFLDKDWLIALFADAGHSWMEGDHDFTDAGSIANGTVSAIGVGLGDDDLDWRINVARPLDGRDTWETTFRLNLNF